MEKAEEKISPEDREHLSLLSKTLIVINFLQVMLWPMITLSSCESTERIEKGISEIKADVRKNDRLMDKAYNRALDAVLQCKGISDE